MAIVLELTHSTQNYTEIETDYLTACIYESESLPGELQTLDTELHKCISNAIRIEHFEGKAGQSVLCYGSDSIQRISLFGLGKQNDITADTARDFGAKITRKANGQKAKNMVVDARPFASSDTALLQGFCEGLALANYEFLDYKSDVKEPNTLETITIIGIEDDAVIGKVNGIIKGVYLARDVSNHPANIATPQYLADAALEIGKADRFETTIIDVSKFQELGMGAFYGVAIGADTPAKLILIQYNGGAEDEKPFALVGKGLTFDSGGISLKPGAKMDEMKFDMCGGATVLGIMKTVAELQPAVNIIAAVGATENMPDGRAQRPGDIVKAYNGKTIEILNTDAEGRLVLADVLSYVADKYEPVGMLDFATLTGAVLVALGHKATGIMGNDEGIIGELKTAAETTGEKVWELPLWKEYCDDIKSKIADIKNLGEGRNAGTIAAGAFLKEFVGDTPWVHLDIAGTAWGAKKPAYLPSVGATGVGVRLVYELIENRIK